MAKRKRKLKLTCELVPEPCWYKNLRNEMPRPDWDRLRMQVYERADYVCEICGDHGAGYRFECHERWHYDDVNHVQTLLGLIALCPMCHRIKNIGVAHRIWKAGYYDLYRDIRNHFMRVNECDLETFDEHHADARRSAFERSKYEWMTDLGEFSDLVRKAA